MFSFPNNNPANEPEFRLSVAFEPRYVSDGRFHPQHWWLIMAPLYADHSQWYSMQLISTAENPEVGSFVRCFDPGMLPSHTSLMEWKKQVATFKESQVCKVEECMQRVLPQRCQDWVVKVLEQLNIEGFVDLETYNHYKGIKEPSLYPNPFSPRKFDATVEAVRDWGLGEAKQNKCCY
ncbi:hypothetical protein BDW59DRAFT_156682 [Aspergillus cavernicola]|uniref:Uncharacterized protein n=1 Tax=Aspergillus cavernicola TaxID=176166 RepID=A0ABR4J1I5_9EURO